MPDGKTACTYRYTGGIDYQLEDCKKYTVCYFDAIKTEMLHLSGKTKDRLRSD